MKTSLKGKIALVVSEGIVDTPYLDAATPPVWTVGVGVTKSAGDIDPAQHKGRVFTVAEVMKMFEKVLPTYEKIVNDNVKVELTQYEYDALVHFVYNIGGPNFKKSKLLKLLNAGDKKNAFQKGFHGWLKPASLAGRRDKERAIAQSGAYGSTIAPLYGVDKNYKPKRKGSIDVAKELNKVAPPPTPEPSKPVPAESNKTPLTPVEKEDSNWATELLKLISNIFSIFKKDK